MTLHPVVEAVTERIRRRSLPTRQAYLARVTQARRAGPVRRRLYWRHLGVMSACRQKIVSSIFRRN